MAISRMQQPRQMYGSLGGLLKKAARGIKKVVKSPLGKAAIDRWVRYDSWHTWCSRIKS